MKNGKTPYQTAPFVEKLFSHGFWVDDGTEWDKDLKEHVPKHFFVRHWGRWQTCAKCEQQGGEANIYNLPTPLGALVIGFATVAGVLLVLFVSGHLQFV